MNALPPALFRRPCVDPDGSVGFAIARCRDLAPRGEGSARVFWHDPQSISARERIVRSTLYLQDGGSYAYSVSAQLNSEGAGVNLDAAADGGFEVYGCKNINDRAFEFPSGRAKELSGDRCLGETYRAHARYFSKGDWFYAVTYLIKIDGGDVSSAQQFLQSFKIDEN